MTSEKKLRTRLSWETKMNKPLEPEIKEAPQEWVDRYHGEKMLIPTPRAIEKIVKTIPKGKLMTSSQLRALLAEEYHADFSCPLTTGIFLRILSEYTEEQKALGKKAPAPYWRVIREDGTLIEKLSGGLENQSALLSAEKFQILQKGKKKLIVKDFEKFLV